MLDIPRRRFWRFLCSCGQAQRWAPQCHWHVQVDAAQVYDWTAHDQVINHDRRSTPTHGEEKAHAEEKEEEGLGSNGAFDAQEVSKPPRDKAKKRDRGSFYKLKYVLIQKHIVDLTEAL